MLQGPDKGPCEGKADKCTVGKCPLFGTLTKPSRDGRRRIRGCGDPTARGKRNRVKGDSKARLARKKMGIPGVNSRHEEVWGGPVRIEAKAGKQIKPIATRFNAARAQSEEARPIGDTRPFVMVALPDGETDGIVLISLSDWQICIRPLMEEI